MNIKCQPKVVFLCLAEVVGKEVG